MQPFPDKLVFVTVVNSSPRRPVEIGAVWFEAQRDVPLLNASRPLPKRLLPDESWETWIRYEEVKKIPASRLFNAARVRISSGAILRSVRNVSVPPVGTSPGG
jgi:hypothetical protein